MAIGIGFTPVGQPTVQPEWFKPPVELMANALMSKEKHYAYNRSLLDNYEQTQNALQSMPGKSKQAHALLQEKWKGMQQDIIDKTGGDLAKADDLLRAYQETLIQDFSGTGLAGVLSSNYENYKNILKQADEMKAKGLYNEAQYWYVVTKAFKEFDDAGGVLGGDEDTGEYKSFYSEPLNPNFDIEEDALKVVKDWLPDSEYKDISELKDRTEVVSRPHVNGYNIYATEDGTEYVDFEEVYTALLKSYSGNEKVQQQIKVQYLYDENFNLLRGEYKQTVEQRLNNYNTELNDHTNIFSQLEKLQSSENVKEIQQFLKETYGSDFSIYNITHLQEYIKQYKDKELKSINNIKENIEVINDRLEKESREDLSRSLNLFDYSQDKIKEKIFLASTKSSYKKEFKKVQWLQEPKEDKPSGGSKGGGKDEEVITTARLVNPITTGLRTNQKEYEKYKESIKNAEATQISTIKKIVLDKLMETKNTSKDVASSILNNIAVENYYKYLDIDGDFNYDEFINDFSKDGVMLDVNGNSTSFTKDFFRTSFNTVKYNVNYNSRALLSSRNERIRFEARERLEEIRFINEQGGELGALASRDPNRIVELDEFKELIESEEESKKNLIEEFTALKELYEKYETNFDIEYNFINFLRDYSNLAIKETQIARREILGAKPVKVKTTGSIKEGTSDVTLTKYNYEKRTVDDYGANKPVNSGYNIKEDVQFNNVSIPASELNNILNKYTPIELKIGKDTRNYYVRSRWNTSEFMAYNKSYKDSKKPSRNDFPSYFYKMRREYGDQKEKQIKDRIVEFTMDFIDVPDEENILKELKSLNINELNGVSFNDANGEIITQSATSILNKQGMVSIDNIVGLQQSRGVILGSEYFKLIFNGKDESDNPIMGSVYVKRGPNSFDVVDDNGNSRIPKVHTVSANLYEAKQKLIKNDNKGAMHIMTVSGVTFQYQNINDNQSINIIKDGVLKNIDYQSGLNFLYDLYNSSVAASNLLKTNSEVKDNIIQGIKINNKSIDTSEVLRSFLKPLISASSDKETFNSTIQTMFDINSNNIISGRAVLVIPKNIKVNNLTELSSELKIVSSVEAEDSNKYIKVYDFKGRNVDDLYKLISVNSRGTRI